MQIALHYGQGQIAVQVPDDNLAGLIVPRNEQADRGQNLSILHNALRCDNLGKFEQAVSNKKLCVLLPDATRDLPVEDCLKAIARQFKAASSVQFILCTGTHTAKTQDNLSLCDKVRQLCKDRAIAPAEIIIHDCQSAHFLYAGTTKRGTYIRYNSAVENADVFLVFSDIKPHYFAGYSNPVKNFVPGICDYETARGNHSLTLDDASTFCAHPWHSSPAQQNQPLAADQIEAMEIIVRGRPVYTFATISSHLAIQWAAFGQIREVCQKAFLQADAWNLHALKPVERMIVSPGGFPNDMDLYIAQRALELTERVVADGGEILFVSACEHGIGPEKSMEHFWNLLIGPIAEIYAAVKGQYRLFSHKPYRFARLIQRLRKLYVYSHLPAEQITAAHMTPTAHPQRIINQWTQEHPQVKILVIDGANKLALRTE